MISPQAPHLNQLNLGHRLGGATSQLIIQPESGVVVTVMVNLSGADLSVADKLAQLFVAAAHLY
ncbi:MAG: hypothetical protein OXM02_11850 [Bacteroidota bacterium]|nr:hypothetical protein [Bacteroidota bacterium]MDE2835195.1 hypothetical protein [Bacteroidota bacterium]MDE2955606.1 hypothetical protein [Bacteroidota bacterium]